MPTTLSIPQVIVLAIVQGLTEFLPVSSKTHLLFARHFMGKEPDLFFDVALHVGSLLALLLYYRRAWWDLLREHRREIPLLVIGTLPAVIAALFLKDRVEELMHHLQLASGLLLVTAAWLFVAERFGREKFGLLEAPWWKALLVGIAQSCALLPGISRAGSTIGMGYLGGLKRADAVRFSFFLGAIAIFGAAVLESRKLFKGAGVFQPLPIVIGVSVTFAVSLAAIKVVEILSLKGRFSWFALYCAVAGVSGLVYFSTRG
jgi:undecaprenyl-diphosphatase